MASMSLFPMLKRWCQCLGGGCSKSLEGLPKLQTIHSDCRQAHNRWLLAGRKLTRKQILKGQAYEFLNGKPGEQPHVAFQNVMAYWIEWLMRCGDDKINIRCICELIRQRNKLKCKNEHIPYFKLWIIENWTEYAKYFKEG